MALSDDGVFEHAARKLRTEVGIDDRFCPDMIFVLDELKKANDPQQSWGFEGEPPEAVIKDSGTRDVTL
jgi:hypothetical protein